MERYVVDITDDALADMDALYEHIAKKLQALPRMLWDSITVLRMPF